MLKEINKKVKEWFGFPLAKTKMPSYLEEVQSVLEERLKELNMAEKKPAKKKAPVKKKAPAKKKAPVKKKAK